MPKREIINILRLTTIIIIVLLMMASVAFANETADLQELDLTAAGSEDTIRLVASDVDGVQYFFLPSGVTEENIDRDLSGDDSCKVMQSSNIASLHFFSSNPEKDISYVNQNKDNKAKGEVYMFDENFQQIYHGSVDAIKGRGNTTWNFTDKKSYQIKLDKKADLLDPVKGKQKAKKWILLANPFDPTLIRNYMIYSFGKEVGLENTPEGIPVDLYCDGQYRGSYYLCEKVEIGDGRVEIDDLEKDIEEANPDVDFDELEEVRTTSAHGLQVKYEEGIADPEDITGGYLLELDSIYYDSEKSWFKYYGPCTAVVKSPEYTSETMIDYISVYLADLYAYCRDASNGKNDGSELPEMIDMDSFARYFLVNEWFGNNDVWTSSTFLYKKRGDEKLYAGPIWDCDSTMQANRDEKTYDVWFATRDGLEPLADVMFRMPVFRQKLQEVYEEDFRSVIFDILLGTESGEYLKSAQAMKEELAKSLEMNYMIWDINDCLGSYYLEDTPEANYQQIFDWMSRRAEWVDSEIMSDHFVYKCSRIYGDTRFETSLKAADEYKAQLGVDKLENVILANGINFADALAGSYLSKVTDAPILLVDDRQDHIDAVQEFIKSNLAQGGTIYILGGEKAVPTAAVSGLNGFYTRRLGGNDRYETNINILTEAAKYSEEDVEYMVASGSNFPDCLSVSAVGKPIILVRDVIQENQEEYLSSLENKKFYVIGGEVAVSPDVEAVFKELGETERIWGDNRFATSTAVAKRFFDEPETAVIAYGMNFPDGLSGGPLAYAMNAPLLLAGNNGMEQDAAAYAAEMGIDHGVVLGGEILISDTSAKTIFSLYSTSAIVVK